MRTVNEITIHAPWARVFEAALKVELWPEILPHYRRVRILSAGPGVRVVEMAAHRDGIPCVWTAEQRPSLSAREIRYFHVRSRFTRGMDVRWILKPLGRNGTAILLTHDLPAEPGLKGWLRQRVVGDLFVHDIAGKTMAGLKRHLEA